jgi:hypothetical protein
MKRNVGSITLIALAVTLVLGAAGSALANDGGHCSRASVAGKWAFTTTGSIPGIGPVAAVGTFTADSSGNLKGGQTRSLNGDVADETFAGTATVNPDCTGTDVIQVFESGALVRTSTLSVVYDVNGREVRAIFTSLVLPDGTSLPTILTIEGKRVFPTDEH